MSSCRSGASSGVDPANHRASKSIHLVASGCFSSQNAGTWWWNKSIWFGFTLYIFTREILQRFRGRKAVLISQLVHSQNRVAFPLNVLFLYVDFTQGCPSGQKHAVCCPQGWSVLVMIAENPRYQIRCLGSSHLLHVYMSGVESLLVCCISCERKKKPEHL